MKHLIAPLNVRVCRLKGDDRENEIEENLQAIDCMVSNLRYVDGHLINVL